MEYKISHEPPPVYEEARKRWGVDFKWTIFTYGDTIHIHEKNRMSADLLAHELVHVKQQTDMGKELWWEKYFADDTFRLSQELEAYRAQYRAYTSNDREQNAHFLTWIAGLLSGPMYGNLMTRSDAIKAITK